MGLILKENERQVQVTSISTNFQLLPTVWERKLISFFSTFFSGDSVGGAHPQEASEPSPSPADQMITVEGTAPYQ